MLAGPQRSGVANVLASFAFAMRPAAVAADRAAMGRTSEAELEARAFNREVVQLKWLREAEGEGRTRGAVCGDEDKEPAAAGGASRRAPRDIPSAALSAVGNALCGAAEAAAGTCAGKDAAVAIGVANEALARGLAEMELTLDALEAPLKKKGGKMLQSLAGAITGASGAVATELATRLPQSRSELEGALSELASGLASARLSQDRCELEGALATFARCAAAGGVERPVAATSSVSINTASSSQPQTPSVATAAPARAMADVNSRLAAMESTLDRIEKLAISAKAIRTTSVAAMGEARAC